jgi:hypothetical protein
MNSAKLKSFDPRRLVKIVTIDPPKGFSYIDSSQGTRRMSRHTARTALNLRIY